MLRTSLRRSCYLHESSLCAFTFLSSNAQDFIEEIGKGDTHSDKTEFLSSNAQDFIEEHENTTVGCDDRVIPEQ